MPVEGQHCLEELLYHGVCEEVERVLLSERYQTMKVHVEWAPREALPTMTVPFMPRAGGRQGWLAPLEVREGLAKEMAADI